MHNLPRVAAESAEEGTVTVHDDESKTLVRLKQLSKSLSVELVVAKVQRSVDRLEGLEILFVVLVSAN